MLGGFKVKGKSGNHFGEMFIYLEIAAIMTAYARRHLDVFKGSDHFFECVIGRAIVLKFLSIPLSKTCRASGLIKGGQRCTILSARSNAAVLSLPWPQQAILLRVVFFAPFLLCVWCWEWLGFQFYKFVLATQLIFLY